MLTSYKGCTGSLMAVSGIGNVLIVKFSGALKMLNDKKFPEYVQAVGNSLTCLRRHRLKLMVTLQHIVDDAAFQC